MKKYCIALFTIILAGNSVFSQSEFLSIGDKLPDYIFDTIINYRKQNVSISDFKGKLVILDSWTTDCGGCLADMPRKDRLQKQFGTEIAIIPIAWQRSGKSIIPEFWKKNPSTKNLSLPCIIDTILKPLLLLPGGPGLQVWIDANGIIKGLTDDTYVNEKEIRKILNGETVNWPIWKRIDREWGKSLVEPVSSIKIPQYSYSWFSPHTEYIRDQVIFFAKDTNNTKRYTGINISVLNLYSNYFSAFFQISTFKNRVIYPSNYINLFFQDKMYYEEWWQKNTYCFEKVTPASISDSVFLLQMKDDLDRYFNFKSSLQMFDRTCLVIKQGYNSIKPDTVSAKKIFATEYPHKWKIQEFLSYINNYTELPVIIPTFSSAVMEELIYVPNVKDEIIAHPEYLTKVIEANGLQLVKESAKIPMIVFEDAFASSGRSIKN